MCQNLITTNQKKEIGLAWRSHAPVIDLIERQHTLYKKKEKR
jgi:hypothetical protein